MSKTHTTRPINWLGATLLLALILFTGMSRATYAVNSMSLAATITSDTTIYDDTLATGWENWSWDSTVNFAHLQIAPRKPYCSAPYCFYDNHVMVFSKGVYVSLLTC